LYNSLIQKRKELGFLKDHLTTDRELREGGGGGMQYGSRCMGFALFLYKIELLNESGIKSNKKTRKRRVFDTRIVFGAQKL
jgi:hypothetical protein